MSKTEKPDASEDTEDFKKKFGELPLNKKMATLMQLEATTMSEALNTMVDKSISAGESVMDKLAGLSRPSKGSEKSK